MNAVIPSELQRQIRAAIAKVGSVGYLAPIKALLPADIDFGVIRCVVEAWKREEAASIQSTPRSAPASDEPPPTPLMDIPFEPLRRWRRKQAAALSQLDYYLLSDEALRKLAQRRPTTKAELRSLPGLSAELIEKHGDELVEVIASASSTEVIDAILECVRSLPGGLPRSGAAKVLVGSASERVERFNSHPLYNRLAGHNRIDVTRQVDALLELGGLAQDEKGHLILKAAPVSSDSQVSLPAASSDLFDRLRAWRLEKARALSVPPFVIFSDDVLRGVASARPQSLAELLALRGIGPAKAEQYGAEVLAIVAQVESS